MRAVSYQVYTIAGLLGLFLVVTTVGYYIGTWGVGSNFLSFSSSYCCTGRTKSLRLERQVI